MRTASLAGLTALALAGGTSLATAAPAQAADGTLYVRQLSSACSDTGPGTLAQPFCSIRPAAAKVTAGQTVDIGVGTYPERVTIASSGTPDSPIHVQGSTTNGTVTLSGATAGVVIDGQHDITISNLRVEGASSEPGLDLRASSAITTSGVNVLMATGASTPAVRLSAVTASFLKQSTVAAPTAVAGLTMDAATRGVTVVNSIVASSLKYDSVANSQGIQVHGSANTIINSQVSGFTGTAIAIEPGAADNVVVNNVINSGAGLGIRNSGATGTAITNNTVQSRCLDGIRVDGNSTRVSVQNNVLRMNGYFGRTNCDPSATGGLELGVYGDAVKDTVVDYNNAYHGTDPAPVMYAWNTPLTMDQFRTASGQATHDLNTGAVTDNYDSANSAAPGYQATDRLGAARGDDPTVPNTGAGPVTYADRGSTEYIRPPGAAFTVGLDLGTSTVKLDASASKPGFVPISEYQFDFGDGTLVTQATPVASHRYTSTGTYTVSVKVSGSDGRSSTGTQSVTVARRTGTIALLAMSGLRYVGAATADSRLIADQAAPGASTQFDLADIGTGRVALFSRATGRYVTSSSSLIPNGTSVDTTGWFRLLVNTDGTISLRALGDTYLSAPSTTAPLTATATTIGAREKFYRVNVADANRSVKAGANSRYVTAESGGARPLIANRTSVGAWERFDLVDLGNGRIAVFARANNRFVCADGTGTKPLIANRLSAGAWETFTLVRNTDGTVSLKAAVNNRYVTADSAGAKPLIANRTAIGPWEKFTLGG
ncbi:PKD domain-containing protein [Micromonospora terminaliae]|uniref:PKD domain-containing protein n=1 Tax=Micromonospora terminaliae TaxID=1914461 RepID=A0AAJ3DHG7_9ACTN|nr:PKD domain-containing protein [Micromonospora terminaliae]NES26071.1 PKD domain-containing protein [Micromonospora terminaliae]QGL50272.1 PKD domain-containing protein [Micromonospora terminaliae]